MIAFPSHPQKTPRMFLETILRHPQAILEHPKAFWNSFTLWPRQIPRMILKTILEHLGAHSPRSQGKPPRWSFWPYWGHPRAILLHPRTHSCRSQEKSLEWSLRPSWAILEPCKIFLERIYVVLRIKAYMLLNHSWGVKSPSLDSSSGLLGCYAIFIPEQFWNALSPYLPFLRIATNGSCKIYNHILLSLRALM